MILEKAQVRAEMMVASNSALADELNELAAFIGQGLGGVLIANFLCRLIQHFLFQSKLAESSLRFQMPFVQCVINAVCHGIFLFAGTV